MTLSTSPTVTLAASPSSSVSSPSSPSSSSSSSSRSLARRTSFTTMLATLFVSVFCVLALFTPLPVHADPAEYIKVFTDGQCEDPAGEIKFPDGSIGDDDVLALLRSQESNWCTDWVCEDAGDDLKATLYVSFAGACGTKDLVLQTLLNINVKGEPDDCVVATWNVTFIESELQRPDSRLRALLGSSVSSVSSAASSAASASSSPGSLSAHRFARAMRTALRRLGEDDDGDLGEGMLMVGARVNCGTPYISSQHWATFTVMTVLAGAAFVLGTIGALVYRKRYVPRFKPQNSVETSDMYMPPSAAAAQRG